MRARRVDRPQARCRYVEAAAHLLITIRAQLIERILQSHYVQVDETFTKLMDPDRESVPRCLPLGLSCPLEKVVVFEFSPTRSGTILYDFFPTSGAGRADRRRAMYPSVFKHRPNITHIECIAHLRRYVVDALKSDERQAVPLYKDISELYRLERVAKDRGLTDQQRVTSDTPRRSPCSSACRRSSASSNTRRRRREISACVTYAKNRWQHLSAMRKLASVTCTSTITAWKTSSGRPSGAAKLPVHRAPGGRLALRGGLHGRCQLQTRRRESENYIAGCCRSWRRPRTRLRRVCYRTTMRC